MALRTFPRLLARFKTGGTATVSQAPANLKRFWKNAGIEQVENGFQIKLDNRSLRTPSGVPVVIPLEKRTLAILTAAEWETQDKVIKSYSLPLTSVVMRALDTLSVPGAREDAIESLLEFVHTDSICYQQDYPDSLVKLQQQYWTPIIRWAEATFGSEVKTTNGILRITQSNELIEKFRATISEYDNFKLAAFEKAVLRSKSFMTGLAMLEGAVDSEFASQASRVEVEFQSQRWGFVEDAHDLDQEDLRRNLASAAVTLIK